MSAHKEFFKQLIYDYYEKDISSCLKVSKIKQEDPNSFPGGLNFTAGLVTLCVLEMMAAYFKGKTTVNKKGRLDQANSREVADFLIKYFSPFFSLFSDKEFSKEFYEVFRHGLVHEFSPKASAVAMAFDFDQPVAVVKDKNEDLMAINIPSFFKISLEAYKKYEDDLNKGKFLKEFNDRYKIMIKNDYEEMRELRKKYLKLYPTLK